PQLRARIPTGGVTSRRATPIVAAPPGADQDPALGPAARASVNTATSDCITNLLPRRRDRTRAGRSRAGTDVVRSLPRSTRRPVRACRAGEPGDLAGQGDARR